MNRSSPAGEEAPSLLPDDPGLADLGRFIQGAIGMEISPARLPLVAGRLAGRLHALNLRDCRDYLRLLENERQEVQEAIDLLCVNETWFFRECQHFSLLCERIIPELGRAAPPRIWSAACATGEEPYSLAMLMAERYPLADWEIVASDVSSKALRQARRGVYPLPRCENIPRHLLVEHCRKGVGACEGTFSIAREVRERVRFQRINLNEDLPLALGSFDLIFLRNVMIYFDMETKRRVVERVVDRLRPGGYLCIGHSETLRGLTGSVMQVQPAVYRKPGGRGVRPHVVGGTDAAP